MEEANAEPIPPDILATLEANGYEVRDFLGRGGYATVFEVFSKKYEDIFVAKAMDICTEKMRYQKTAFDAEVNSLCNLIHPNIIKIYDHFTDEKRFYQILELCEKENLYDRIIRTGPIVEDLKSFMKQILNAMVYCHAQGITHSDIKPANILIDHYGRPKIADFGLAMKLQDSSKLINGFRGSKPYMAPEILLKKKYDPFKADVWSLGVTFYFIAFGRLPWNPSDSNFISIIKEGLVSYPQGTDPELIHMLKKLLTPSPMMRASMEDLLRSRFFSANKLEESPSMGNMSSQIFKKRRGHIKTTRSSIGFATLKSPLMDNSDDVSNLLEQMPHLQTEDCEEQVNHGGTKLVKKTNQISSLKSFILHQGMSNMSNKIVKPRLSQPNISSFLENNGFLDNQ